MNTLGLVYLSIKHEIEPRFLYAGTVLLDMFLIFAAYDIYFHLAG